MEQLKKILLLLGLMLFAIVQIQAQQRPVIYQMLVRLFGNKNTTNAYYGSMEQNGCGKFNDITDRALDSLKTLGLTHIWYTGVIAHASMADYSSFGIAPDDPDVVKGRAGSPYAIRDYYDVDPDLAVNVPDRMLEYESLIKRTHAHRLKVLMDFIPNHVARTYHSYAKPASILDFGEKDDTALAFSNQNDFYYLPGTRFQVPKGVDAGGPRFQSPLKDGKFDERPAKATGNDVFRPDPSIDDWYETIKLNYGVDLLNQHEKHFSPIPPVWNKMKAILLYWAGKGVDGFRCDMAEMVPVEFWDWAITQVKKQYPNILFIAEAYNPQVYQTYIKQGKFDYLYDKVGMYDAVKKLIQSAPDGNVQKIDSVEKSFPANHLIRFLENHDEERIASSSFAGNPALAIPGMVVMATLSNNPIMIYFGQEVGEKGGGKEGFGGEDGRTSLFDYWGVPAHQVWMNDGLFDGGKLRKQQRDLRSFYQEILTFANKNAAAREGKYVPYTIAESNTRQMAYFRLLEGHLLLVIVNFDRLKTLEKKIVLPQKLMQQYKMHKFVTVQDILLHTKTVKQPIDQAISLYVKPASATILEIQ